MPLTENIHLRLVLPFVLVLAVAVTLAGWIATRLLSHTLEQRLTGQLDHAAAVMAEGTLPLTSELLANLARLQQAAIVLIGTDQRISLIGLDPQDPALRQQLENHASRWPAGWQQPVHDTFSSGQATYLLVGRPLPVGRDPRYQAVVLLASLADLQQAVQRAAGLLAGAALAGVLLLAWLGSRLARSITAPIHTLADMAARIAAGDRQVRSPLCQANAIGVLAAALNSLVERLATYEADVAEKSRLAAIGQTTARIAHEIRNPLTALKLQLELLHETVAATQQPLTRQLLDEIRRLELIVGSTLALSRPLQLDRQPTDLNRLVGEVVQLLAAQFEHRGIRLETALAAGLPLAALDADRIKQLLLNLLMNAGDELPEGGVIQLTTAGQGTELVLGVADSGPGIAVARRVDLFSGTPSSKRGGLGLGLPLCKEIAELHGGRIAVTDSALGGAEFQVSLPIANPP
jgi:signal transduction histidine kinase